MLVDIAQMTATVDLASGDLLTTVDSVSLCLRRGSSYSVVGKSGSGKTSLVSIIGLLNTRFSGSFHYNGEDVATMSDRRRALLRANSIGFVFQNYSLIPHLSAWENVALPLAYGNITRGRKAKMRAYEMLEEVELAERATAMPSHLSGGEQQRVAIARALVCNPELLICDEPTGALDTATGMRVMEMLAHLVSEHRMTMLLVTHDADVAAICEEGFVMESSRLSPC